MIDIDDIYAVTLRALNDPVIWLRLLGQRAFLASEQAIRILMTHSRVLRAAEFSHLLPSVEFKEPREGKRKAQWKDEARKRKAQWKDEARMRNGKRWKR